MSLTLRWSYSTSPTYPSRPRPTTMKAYGVLYVSPWGGLQFFLSLRFPVASWLATRESKCTASSSATARIQFARVEYFLASPAALIFPSFALMFTKALSEVSAEHSSYARQGTRHSSANMRPSVAGPTRCAKPPSKITVPPSRA